MENNWGVQQGAGSAMSAETISKTYIAGVFKWMFVALGLSAFCAYIFASNDQLLSYLKTDTGLTGLGILVFLAPIGFVIWMSVRYQKMSYSSMLLSFLLYSAINGISFCFILLNYTSESIVTTFLTAAVMFGVMAIMGYTTKQDLTKFGSLMFMALIGIIVAGLLNLLFQSETMSFVISVVGVLVFTGLTAYDVQKLKNIGVSAEPGTEATGKMTLMGALTLYLDFINLFLLLLRVFGGRK